ncbi:RHS repeat-associated protein [Kibdelosporangium banguiense]|uniref:RHS repeat-associated protein n=1 Tax=Kibdelosporangium banguiense TaxID=1365924 RepID=A0ABS4TCX3_9PSEU|nr:RHS repeat-associated core domain-containing protein [Kibdelosporangium banguiense]MBP2321698.1 RHS repeat-associated protein [Kibdelosporangium banguiense]
MSDGNPLVATAQSDTTAVTGIGIAESSVDLANGISNGDWVEAGLGAVGVGLEVLSMVIDPIGTIASYGVSWLIEHVQPLKEALDWFAGDPPVIRSFSETWANIAAEVGKVAADYGNEAKAGTGGWTGQSADTYRGKAAETADAISGAGALADGISAGVMIMGEVVAAVREIVRDLVAEVVGKLITWALEAVATLGLGTPVIVAQATAAISKVVNKIADLVRKLVKTIGNVTPRIRKVIDKLDEIIAKLGKLGRKGDAPSSSTTPSSSASAPDGVRSPDTPGTSTTPSGTDTPDVTSPDGTTSPSGTKSSDEPNMRQETSTDPQGKAREENNRVCKDDPIDIASGEMILPQTDVDLAGVLPLVLRRTHVSTYRVGRTFGRSWASTLDQRLEADANGVYFAAEDGMQLKYPAPLNGTSVLPAYGPRWPLDHVPDGGYTITNPETGLVRHFGPTTAGALPIQAISDRNGNRIVFHYDDEGVLTDVRHSGGYHLRVETTDRLVVAIHLVRPAAPEVTLVRYRYDEALRLSEVVNSSGSALRFEYDSSDRIVQWVDRNEMWYRYTYDEHGRCVRTQGGDGFLNGTFAYQPGRTVWTDSHGHDTVFHLNDYRQVVREVDQLGAVTLSEWDRYDRLLARTDPLGRTTRYDYDGSGDLIAIVRPDSEQTSISYNSLRLPTRIVDPDGGVWLQSYDQKGNLTSVTDPSGAVTQRIHDARGNIAEVVDALGNRGRIVCDAAGLPVALTDPMGGITRYVRDPFGRIGQIIDPVGGVTRLNWTVEGRLVSRTLPDGGTERWRYDGEGNVVEHVDAVGQVTRTTYVGFDQPSSKTGPDGGRLQFAYDTELRLVSVTNPQGLIWRYEYDAAGRLVRETDFNGRVIAYRHDAAGQVVERANGAGEVTTFTRDALGQIVEKRSGESLTTFAYDKAGRVVRATNSDADVTFERDALGRVLAETTNGRTVRSTYDLTGRRITRQTPTGVRSTWHYNANDQPVALHTAGRTLQFSYDAAGREVARHLGGAVSLAQSWDAGHRLLRQTIATHAGQPVQQRAYHYRPDGNLARVDDQLGGSRRFELDRSGRVTAVHGARWTERYAYDTAGNVTTATPGPREYAGTLVRRAGNVYYQHDAQGRVILRNSRSLSGKTQAWTYTWDADDRLTGVTTPDGTRWRYAYDPAGRRIAKKRLAETGVEVVEQIDFTWDGSVLAEQTQSGRAVTWDFEPGSMRAVSQLERAQDSQAWIDRQFYAIVTDLIGTPTEMLDPDGGLAWRSQTNLWGAALAELSGGPSCPLRFPGQYHDPETGQHYNYHRYYDPVAGQYLSSDPLGLSAGPNSYAYVSNPTRQYDPFGLTACERAKRLANRTTENARNGRVRETPDYHGRLSRERELEILSNPDAVYHSTGTGGRFIFRQGEDVVITQGPGSQAGQLVTSYGPSGPRGDSGAAIFGGSPSDPGLPVTHEQIVNGTVPTPSGDTLPPAVQILP